MFSRPLVLGREKLVYRRELFSSKDGYCADGSFPEVLLILSRRSAGDVGGNRSEFSAGLCVGGRLDCVSGGGERRLRGFNSLLFVFALVRTKRSGFCSVTLLVGVTFSGGFDLFAGFNLGIFPKLTGGGFTGGGSVETLGVTEVFDVSDDFFSTIFVVDIDGGRTDGFSLLLALVDGLARGVLSGVFVVTVVVVVFLVVITVSLGAGTGLKTRKVNRETMI